MKHIVVIGASSGLGERIASEFASMGWRVGAAARRLDRLEALAGRHPGSIEYEAIDITRPDAPARLESLIWRIGGIDVFLMASGTGRQNPLLADDIERLTVETNCTGFTAMVDAAFRYFASRPQSEPRPLIAAITSVAGTKGLGAAPSYSASKRYQSTYLTALEQLAHIRHIPIDFCDIRPGFIATDLLDPSDSYPMLMTADHTVPLIVKAILRRRRVAIIDRRWWWVVKAWSIIPRSLWVRINATTRKTTT